MPIPIPLDQIALMEKSGVQARFACYAGNPSSPDPKLQAPRHTCEMVDVTTGAIVLKTEGDSRIVSLNLACKDLAKLNRKPAMQGLADSNAALIKERDDLAAKLAALQSAKTTK